MHFSFKANEKAVVPSKQEIEEEIETLEKMLRQAERKVLSLQAQIKINKKFLIDWDFSEPKEQN